MLNQFRSHGSGQFVMGDFASVGENVVIEPSTLVFHPENIRLGSNVYVGHHAILKGYYRNQMSIDDDVWIGQQCFLHSAGGLSIGAGVGLGPGVKIITSFHADPGRQSPIMTGEIQFAPVSIGRFSDIGVGCVILPGVVIGEGTQVGAGAVVTKNTPPYSVVAGAPAKVLRLR
jgi:acetyltransferase-like isoleucine patch superfamily enzyme